MLKQICLVALVALTVVGIGCSDDDKGANSNGAPPNLTSVPSDLIATWTFQSATINNVTVDDLSMVLPWAENTAHARISIKGDESFVFENVDADDNVLLTETGSFTVDSNGFSLTGDDELSLSGNWAVSGDSLTLTGPLEGYPHLTVKLIATK